MLAPAPMRRRHRPASPSCAGSCTTSPPGSAQAPKGTQPPNQQSRTQAQRNAGWQGKAAEQRARPPLGGAHHGSHQTASRKPRAHAYAQSAPAPSARPPQRQAAAQVPGAKWGSMLRCCSPAADERRRCAPCPDAAAAAPRHRLRPGGAPDELPLLGKSSRRNTPYIDSASESRDTAYKKHIVSYGKSDLETVSGRNKRHEQTT